MRDDVNCSLYWVIIGLEGGVSRITGESSRGFSYDTFLPHRGLIGLVESGLLASGYFAASSESKSRSIECLPVGAVRA